MCCISVLSFYVLTISHNLIGILYLVVAIICGLTGYILSVVISIELSVLGSGILFGDFQFYNCCITAHGLIMIFAFVMPILLGGFTNYFVPILLGYPDMLFPSLNNVSFWLFLLGCCFLVQGMLTEEGIGTGWTLYPSLICADFHIGIACDCAIFSVHLLGISSIVNSINIIGTIWIASRNYVNNFNLFLWGLVCTSILLILTLPVLAGGVSLILFDRNLNTAFYDVCGGGDVVLFQHLFWFFGHPEVYIIILPIFGLISFILDATTGTLVFSTLSMLYSMLLISTLGFFVWAHHMFVIGMDIDSRSFFGSLTLLIGLPTGIKLFNWLLTVWFVDIYCCLEVIFVVLMFIFVFIMGGITGLLLANCSLDIALHDTYFVVAHFHYVLSLGAVIGILAAFYYFCIQWFLIESVAVYMFVSTSLLFCGLNCTFWPLHEVGLLCFPSSISDFCVDIIYNAYIILQGMVIITCWVGIILYGSTVLLYFNVVLYWNVTMLWVLHIFYMFLLWDVIIFCVLYCLYCLMLHLSVNDLYIVLCLCYILCSCLYIFII